MTHPDGTVVERLSQRALAVLAPVVFSWQARQDVAARIADDVRGELGKTGDLKRAAAFHAACPVAGAQTADYCNRLFDVDGVGAFIAGPRFRALRPDEPFVDIVTAEHAGPVQALSGMVSAVEEAFAWQRPRWVRVLASPGAAASMPDLVVRAGCIAEIQAAPPPPSPMDVQLRRWTDVGALPHYDEAVAELQANDPAGARWYWPTTPEDFVRLVRDGLVFDAVADGSWAGVVAAAPRTTLGLTGYRMSEELLAWRLRGRGLAAVAQRLLVDELDPAGGAVLAGEIDTANMASVRTAARVGRPEIARFVFMPTVWHGDDRPRW